MGGISNSQVLNQGKPLITTNKPLQKPKSNVNKEPQVIIHHDMDKIDNNQINNEQQHQQHDYDNDIDKLYAELNEIDMDFEINRIKHIGNNDNGNKKEAYDLQNSVDENNENNNNNENAGQQSMSINNNSKKGQEKQ
eukprot:116410_1